MSAAKRARVYNRVRRAAAMREDIPTYRIALCFHCGEPIAEIRDPYSGVLDWYSDGGDFGCDESPDTDEEGCGSHAPPEAA